MRKNDKSPFPFLRQGLSFLACFLLLKISVQAASLVDATYKVKRQLAIVNKADSKNEVREAYKNFFAKSMNSQCRWFPSDSEFMSISSLKCGALTGTLSAVSRFMTEHDAAHISLEAVNEKNHLRFIDFEFNCDLF